MSHYVKCSFRFTDYEGGDLWIWVEQGGGDLFSGKTLAFQFHEDVTVEEAKKFAHEMDRMFKAVSLS